MRESGLGRIETASEYKSGLTEPSTKESGKATELMEEENFGILMEITSKANGKMIRLVERGCIFTPMGPSMREIGSMTYNTDSVLNHGPTQQDLKGSIRMEKRKASENIIGVMDQPILAIGATINCVGLVFILGQMGEYFLFKLEIRRVMGQ